MVRQREGDLGGWRELLGGICGFAAVGFAWSVELDR